MECKSNILTQRRLGLLAGKPEHTSFATKMDFTFSDETLSISKEI
jgi:hypothetical protein